MGLESEEMSLLLELQERSGIHFLVEDVSTNL